MKHTTYFLVNTVIVKIRCKFSINVLLTNFLSFLSKNSLAMFVSSVLSALFCEYASKWHLYRITLFYFGKFKKWIDQ